MKTHDSTTSTLESQMRLLAERELDQVAAAGSKPGVSMGSGVEHGPIKKPK